MAASVSQDALLTAQTALARVRTIRTPVPATVPTPAAQLARQLGEGDERIDAAFALLTRDAAGLERIDRVAFVARCRAALLDLDLANELQRALAAANPAHEAALLARGPLAAERRLALRRWMRQAGADV